MAFLGNFYITWHSPPFFLPGTCPGKPSNFTWGRPTEDFRKTSCACIPGHSPVPSTTKPRNMKDRHVSGLQLDAVTKRNPVITQTKHIGSGSGTGFSNSRIRVESAGVALAINAHFSKTGKLSGGGSKARSQVKQAKRPWVEEEATNTSTMSGEISECSTVWSILGFFITTSNTAICFVFSINKDTKYAWFYYWVALPLCCTTMIISGVLKPRLQSRRYKALLILQYGLFSVVSEIFLMAGFNFQPDAILWAGVRCVFWVAIVPLFMFLRRRIGRLPDEDLTNFLALSVVRGGLLVGLAQLTFLAFASIQCENEASLEDRPWWECKRALFSQAGLASFLALYTTIKLVAGIAPKKVSSA